MLIVTAQSIMFKKEEGAGMKGILPPPRDKPDRLGEVWLILFTEAIVGGRASVCLPM
jgi:hypothetical protein